MATIDKTEWAIRTQLAAAYRLVAHFGWDDLVFTHLSARLPGDEPLFLINRYGLLFEEVTAANLLKIDANGTPVDAAGEATSIPGFTIHSAIHLARADAHAVMHVHTSAGLAVSACEDGLRPLTQTALLAYSDIGYHEYEGIAVDLDERQRIVRDLGDHHNLILRNHGLLTVGGTVPEAFMRLYFLQRACEAQVLTTGTSTRTVSDEVRILTGAQGKAMMPSLARVAWPGLLRRLSRLHAKMADGFDVERSSDAR